MFDALNEIFNSFAKKVRDYADLKKDTQLAICVGLVNTRSNDTVLNMCIDCFEFIRKYANENIKNTDLRDRILEANNSLYRLLLIFITIIFFH